MVRQRSAHDSPQLRRLSSSAITWQEADMVISVKPVVFSHLYRCRPASGSAPLCRATRR